MNLDSLLRGVDYRLLQGGEREIGGICADSREAAPGSLFVCIRGLRDDARRFIPDAVARGAAAIVVDADAPPVDASTAVLRVGDSRSALSFIASNFYGNPDAGLRVHGITGTNGKSSTAFFLQALLEAGGRRTGLIGTVETRVGREPLDIAFATSTTPDPIELMSILAEMRGRGAVDAVMEVSSHSLALRKLDAMSFRTAVFTNLTQDHLDLHGDMEAYKATKLRLFSLCETGIVNADDPASGDFMRAAAGRVSSFGIREAADLAAEGVECGAGGVSFGLVAGRERLGRFSVPIPGRFTVYNSLGAIAAALSEGLDPRVIRERLSRMEAVPGRIQSIAHDGGFSVFVDYAHTPDGLENIISAVREFTAGRVITVFGCGGDRDRAKRPLMGEISGRLSDITVISSDNPRSEDPEAIMAEIEAGMEGGERVLEADREEAIALAISMAAAGDSVIIAGKGHESSQVFADRTLPFDDVEVARRILTDGYYSPT
ncbi:MAG: UDP-N-acetylmuramoyl-L-alanyl-D-glutamate--2,6-diaminopimelate ligase [Clostridiales Family XIII bacterium]|jgi:UDP-N-acetylmuramoyl-L-alanyl-D-glutamate--2,6-diaminopimelate ligase|nr:UDP-N-acetylmuramoyl-L-alanyl-D-glutamate--2,6-diaminopimelate ligase [Clostridiales Family XIII bacterium]